MSRWVGWGRIEYIWQHGIDVRTLWESSWSLCVIIRDKVAGSSAPVAFLMQLWALMCDRTCEPVVYMAKILILSRFAIEICWFSGATLGTPIVLYLRYWQCGWILGSLGFGDVALGSNLWRKLWIGRVHVYGWILGWFVCEVLGSTQNRAYCTPRLYLYCSINDWSCF